MQKWLVSVVILVLTFAATGHAQRGGGPSRPVAGHGVEVPGWSARVDDPKQGVAGLKFVSAGGGMHVTTGPNVTLWDPQQAASGEYVVRATFTVPKAPSHPVAYGLIFGGADLTEDSQKYSYFVIREDGQFLVRRRDGAKTMSVGGDWAAHAAVAGRMAAGQKNELAVQVGGGRVRLLANGQEVASHPASALDTEGIVGLRIGHGLDVQVDGLTVEQK